MILCFLSGLKKNETKIKGLLECNGGSCFILITKNNFIKKMVWAVRQKKETFAGDVSVKKNLELVSL